MNPENLVVFGLSPRLNGYSPDETRALFERVEDELMAVPGVTGVAASIMPLISGSNWGNSVAVQGFEAGPDTDVGSSFSEVGPDFFRTIGVGLVAGREFTRADALGAPKVAIVNEAFAGKFGLGRDAVGKYMSQDSGAGAKLDIQIVGLVQNAKYSEVKQLIPPQFFIPYRQDERIGFCYFYVRTAVNAESLLAAVPGVIRRLDPNLPVEELKTMPQQVRENVFLDRVISLLSASFASLATVLAAIGLYGVLAYTVAQRTREIGLRMALGADGGRVRGMVLSQVGRMTIVGGVVGLAAAVGIGRLAQSLLYEMEGYDPVVLTASALLLTLVAFLAGFVPALRASRIDPMRALRYE
jgi:predicted permease